MECSGDPFARGWSCKTVVWAFPGSSQKGPEPNGPRQFALPDGEHPGTQRRKTPKASRGKETNLPQADSHRKCLNSLFFAIKLVQPHKVIKGRNEHRSRVRTEPPRFLVSLSVGGRLPAPASASRAPASSAPL